MLMIAYFGKKFIFTVNHGHTGSIFLAEIFKRNLSGYDFKHIDKCLRQTIQENSSWRYILTTFGCNYINMNFYYVHNNLTESIEQVGSFIGVGVDPEKISKEKVAKKRIVT